MKLNPARAPKALPVALTLARTGFKVIQVSPISKHPTMPDWPNRATSDVGLILRWDGHWPGQNWGVLTGRKGGLLVLDADGERGIADLARLEAEHGALRTLRVRSGRGEHVWLRLPPGDDDVRNQQPLAGTRVDVRGYHGQAVIPGSLHKSGRRYEWLPGCAPGEIELAVCPPEWWAWLPKRESAASVARSKTPRARRVTGAVAAPQHDRTGGIIGDGEGAGGFNRPIRSHCCSWFARFGVDSDTSRFKEVLRTTILKADASAHTPEQVARYASDQYLDAEIASARNFIMEKNA
jgi:hypothetical protein